MPTKSACAKLCKSYQRSSKKRRGKFGLEDLGESGRQYQAVINSADWTVETIIQQIDKGNIELNPDFQRREAWHNPRKSQYIESLILNVPVPQVVLERKDRRKFIVIDGKQRLLALRQ